jgi:hypothetical protein
LQVPRSAIVEEVGQSNVFVVEDELALRKPVETGYSDAGMIEIISGLTDDDEIVTVGQVGLKHEARVIIINAAEGNATQVGNNASTD